MTMALWLQAIRNAETKQRKNLEKAQEDMSRAAFPATEGKIIWERGEKDASEPEDSKEDYRYLIADTRQGDRCCYSFLRKGRRIYLSCSEGRSDGNLRRFNVSRPVRLTDYRHQDMEWLGSSCSTPVGCTKLWKYWTTKLHLRSTLEVHANTAKLQTIKPHLFAKQPRSHAQDVMTDSLLVLQHRFSKETF